MPPRTAHRPTPLLVCALGLSVTACSGTGPVAPAEPPAQTEHASAAAVARQLDTAEFAEAVADDRTFVVNVHVPDEGSIGGTDAAIPYDRIRARASDLPADRGAPLAVYCKSGRMSSEAVATLQQLGYADVVELRGGMNAWVADGRELLPPAA